MSAHRNKKLLNPIQSNVNPYQSNKLNPTQLNIKSAKKKQEELKKLHELDEESSENYKKEKINEMKNKLKTNDKEVITKQEELKNLQKIEEKFKKEDIKQEILTIENQKTQLYKTIKEGQKLIMKEHNKIQEERKTLNNLKRQERQEQLYKQNEGLIKHQNIVEEIKNINIPLSKQQQQLKMLPPNKRQWELSIDNFEKMEKLKNENNQQRIKDVEKLSGSLYKLYKIYTDNSIPADSIFTKYKRIINILDNDGLNKVEDIFNNLIGNIRSSRNLNCDFDNDKSFQFIFTTLINNLIEYFTEYLDKKYSQQYEDLNKNDKDNNVTNTNNSDKDNIIQLNKNTLKQIDECNKEEEEEKEEEKENKEEIVSNNSKDNNENNIEKEEKKEEIVSNNSKKENEKDINENNIEKEEKKQNEENSKSIKDKDIHPDNVENVEENANAQQEPDDEEDYKNIIKDFVNNAKRLPAGTNLIRFREFYHRNTNILQHKTAIFWLNEQERRNNALLEFINNGADESLETLNKRLKDIRGGKCSWCGGDY